MKNTNKLSTRQLAGLALFTALVVVLQLLGSFIQFGPVSIQLVALPIIVGSALYGMLAGLWLGFVFSLTVLLTGGAALFMTLNPIGCLLVLFAKGMLCGLAAGGFYQLLKKKNTILAAVASALVCPVVNTGVFIFGCLLFFYPTILGWAQAAGFGDHATAYMILSFAGLNFLVELIIDVVLCPVIIRLINYGKRDYKR